jgi:hypothetical protein
MTSHLCSSCAVRRNTIACPPDLGWITTFLSLGHVHVVILLSCLARSVYGKFNEEVKLAYLVSALLCLEISIGIFSKPDLHRPFLVIQLLVWIVLLICMQWFTFTEFDEPLRWQERAARFGGATPTPRELFAAVSRMQNNTSTRSLGGRSGFATPSNRSVAKSLYAGKYPILSIALGIVTIGSLVQMMELVLDEHKTSYYVGASASIRYVLTGLTLTDGLYHSLIFWAPTLLSSVLPAAASRIARIWYSWTNGW